MTSNFSGIPMFFSLDLRLLLNVKMIWGNTLSLRCPHIHHPFSKTHWCVCHTNFKKGTPERWRYSIVNVDGVVPSSYVLGEGILLHQVRWLKGSTYKDLAQSYVPYVFRHYNNATIVFDGYNNPLSINTNTDTRRSPIRCQDVVINEINIFQEKFLSKENN